MRVVRVLGLKPLAWPLRSSVRSYGWAWSTVKHSRCIASLTRIRMASPKPLRPRSVMSCKTLLTSSKLVWLVMSFRLLDVFADNPKRELHDELSTSCMRDAPPKGEEQTAERHFRETSLHSLESMRCDTPLNIRYTTHYDASSRTVVYVTAQAVKGTAPGVRVSKKRVVTKAVLLVIV